VCYDLGFPVFVLERSPLVLRDLDLLQEINKKSRAVVAFSIISTPSSPYYERVCQIERLAPPAEKRFTAMEEIANTGIMTGTCFMPILPGLCDDDANLHSVVQWTADHGGQFVLASGLTLSDQQRKYFFQVLCERFPDLLNLYQRLFPEGSYSSSDWGWRETALRVKELCQQFGIKDRMPRPIIEGEKRARNKKIVEMLANRVYDMELQNTSPQRVWAYRKAAWAIEDLEQDVGLIYSKMGLKGLESIPNIGTRIAKEIAGILNHGTA